MFINSSPQNYNDYRLLSGSPAIDAGNSGVSSTVTKDFSGSPRPMDGSKNGTAEYDIGAYEYDGEYIPPASNGIPAAPEGLRIK